MVISDKVGISDVCKVFAKLLYNQHLTIVIQFTEGVSTVVTSIFSAELFQKYQISFYADPINAVFKVLWVNWKM